MARPKCETCGAELEDGAQRFCGGDRCGRVFMRHALRPIRGRVHAEVGDEVAHGVLQRAAWDLGALRH
jgi:hypothetical protein